MRIPLFPLDTVLFPDGTLLLQIFEPRYLQMVKHCMQNESGFGVCLIDDEASNDGGPTICKVGTHATIYDFEKLDNGMLGLHCRGDYRFRVANERVEQDDLLYGSVQLWPEQHCQQEPGVMKTCIDYLRQFVTRNEIPITLDEQKLLDPNWVSYRLGEILPLTSHSRQTILEMDDTTIRLKTLYAVVQTLDQGTRLS